MPSRRANARCSSTRTSDATSATSEEPDADAEEAGPTTGHRSAPSGRGRIIASSAAGGATSGSACPRSTAGPGPVAYVPRPTRAGADERSSPHRERWDGPRRACTPSSSRSPVSAVHPDHGTFVGALAGSGIPPHSAGLGLIPKDHGASFVAPPCRRASRSLKNHHTPRPAQAARTTRGKPQQLQGFSTRSGGRVRLAKAFVRGSTGPARRGNSTGCG